MKESLQFDTEKHEGGCAYTDVLVVQALQYHTHRTKDDFLLFLI
jgi:hypothetical protein